MTPPVGEFEGRPASDGDFRAANGPFDWQLTAEGVFVFDSRFGNIPRCNLSGCPMGAVTIKGNWPPAGKLNEW